MKKLGIVLPTYNRCSYLKVALEALLPQIERHKDEVQLFVTDNASEDGTEVFMSEFVSLHPGLVEYYRHERNIEGIPNFLFGISHIDAEYVFMHGDDDLSTPFFIEYILNLLYENKDIDLIHFNYFISSLDGSPIRMVYKNFGSDCLKYKYDNLLDFLANRFDIPSFMSSNVFKKENWDRNVNDKGQYGCTGYEWLYIMYKGCRDSKCMFIEVPLFVQRMSNLGSYSNKWALYSIISISKVFEHLGPDYYEKWKDYRKSYSTLKMLRNIGSVYTDKKTYRKRYKEINNYLYSWFYKFFLFSCLFLIPVWLEKVVFEKAKRLFV